MGAPTKIHARLTGLMVDVETSPGSGIFRTDARLRATDVEHRSDDRISEATILVRLDDGFDAHDARDRYLPDCRVVVWADDPGDGSRQVLFNGYPFRHVSDRDGRPSKEREVLRIEAVGVYSRWAADVRSQIFGRRMRSAAIVDGLATDPEGFANSSVLVEALPCVFNDGGLPNRSPDPVTVIDIDGTKHRVFIFTYEGDPSAQSWTLLDALRYVLWFYRLSEGPVDYSHLLGMTAAGSGLEPDALGGFVPQSRLVLRLLASADDLNCEATNLVEAIALIAERAGIHATCEAESVDGVARSLLRLWAPEDGEDKSLCLAWGGRYGDGSRRYDSSVVTDRDILEANEISSMELDWDNSAIVNAPKVVGAAKRWEMTVPLVPGWVPEVNLDDVDPPDREVAKLLALTPEQVNFAGPDVELSAWYRKYHRNGSEFEDHRNVSRLWVLNEDGAFAGATYNRNAPFDSYEPYDFTTVADERVTSPGQWIRRPRPFKPSITLAADGSDFGVHIEVSFDGGLSWSKPIGQVSVLKDRAGIWFGVVNPTSMIEPDGNPAERNMWYALIDQVFSVRVTAVFEADERLVATHPSNTAHTPTIHQNAQLVYKPGLYKFASRMGTVDALAEVDSGAQVFEVDDSSEALAVATSLAANQQEGRIEIEAKIPWIDTRFDVGDRVVGIGSRGVRLNGRLARSLARDADWSVVGKTYEQSDTRAETRLLLTRRLSSA
ncbi:MAG: hypothetical protein DHS20C16_24120 [Phycisphaerae bacterium]|nr:MAG: hypothetical protein DHS20C16_24120 [Phycisphaerae bacterium]